MNQLALPTAPQGFFDLDLLLPALGLTDPKWARKVVLRMTESGALAHDEFRAETRPKIGRGRPEAVYFLSLSGALAFAARADTPEAATWRQEHLAKLATRREDDGRIAALEARVAIAERALATIPTLGEVLTEIRALRASHDGMRLEVAAMRADLAKTRTPAPALPAAPPSPAPLPEPGPLFPPREDPYDVLYREIRPVMLDPFRLRGVTAADLLDLLTPRVKEGLETLKKGDALTTLTHVLMTWKREGRVREMGTRKGAKLWGLIT